MASFKKLPSGAVQICVRHRLLPKPLWATFDDEMQARAYARQLEALLGQGIVPAALLAHGPPPRAAWAVSRCIAEYLRANSVPLSDIKLLDTVAPQLALLNTSVLNYDWAEGWVRSMKREANLAPSTIRHRHGALARCFDWMTRKHPDILVQNPLRLLKRGFATCTEEDERCLAEKGLRIKVDEERDRRLLPPEEARIDAVLDGHLQNQTFFTLALESAMRMRECYTVLLSQVALHHKTVNLDRSKNGDSRQVPLSSPAIAALGEYIEANRAKIEQHGGRIFTYWDGDRSVAALDATTRDLSREFRLHFEKAEVLDFHFHDLRHEATCRLYERTNLSDVLIAKITGHRDLRMLKRYASLRGSELAARLW